MKNVLICAIAGERYAIELRWVREIATLGALTGMPAAPVVVAGVTSFKGALVPVMHAGHWLLAVGAPLAKIGRAPRAGDAMVLLDIDGARAAMAVERIDAVTTLTASPPTPTASPEILVDAGGKSVPLLEPPALMSAARRLIAEAAAALPALLASSGRST